MWIVYDPEPEAEVARFATDLDAVDWVANEIAMTDDPDRQAMLKRCVVIPHDPERDDT